MQFVRKISGFRQPAGANVQAFDAAVKEIAASSQRLLASITDTSKPPAPLPPPKPSTDRRYQR